MNKNSAKPFRADIVIVDKATGSERMIVEVKSHPVSTVDKHQLIEYLHLARVRVALLVDPKNTIVFKLRSFEAKPETISIKTERLGIDTAVKSEIELERRVLRALQSLSFRVAQGDYQDIPEELFPDFVAALRDGEILSRTPILP